MSENKRIVFYHYRGSPFAKRILWYLTLRNIEYSQCLQPIILPRPDLKLLGVSYRRIPVLAINRDIYCDTRLQLKALETHFPTSTTRPSINPNTPEHTAICALFEKWSVDGGLFGRGALLIPADGEFLSNPKVQKDRRDFSAFEWSKETVNRARPESMVSVREVFGLLEDGLLRDGRRWIVGTGEPTLADIEAVWVVHWLSGLKGALDEDIFNPKTFPKTYAYIERFNARIKEKTKSHVKPTDLKGEAAAEAILSASYVEQPSVDRLDPLRLSGGELVEVWPTDTGFNHRDSGKLLGLDRNQIVIERKAADGKSDVRIHFPRALFRVRLQKAARI